MLTDKLFGSTKLPLLAKGLDAYALRHRAIADNVANVMTHGYTRKKVEFESKLSTAMKGAELKQTDSKHLSSRGSTAQGIKPEIELDKTPSDINELNNVDIDAEMSDMAQNQLQFQFASHMSKLYFQLLNTSIRGM